MTRSTCEAVTALGKAADTNNNPSESHNRMTDFKAPDRVAGNSRQKPNKWNLGSLLVALPIPASKTLGLAGSHRLL